MQHDWFLFAAPTQSRLNLKQTSPSLLLSSDNTAADSSLAREALIGVLGYCNLTMTTYYGFESIYKNEKIYR